MQLYHSRNGKRVGQAYRIQHVIRISPELDAELKRVQKQGRWHSLNELIESILSADLFDEITLSENSSCESAKVCSSPRP